MNYIKNLKAKVFLLLLSTGIAAMAQNGKQCIDAVLKLEENTARDFTDENVVYMNYSVKTTDWEGQIVSSEVKVYKGKDNTHFFSDQATIYQDKKDVYMVLPAQKLVIVNSTKKELYDQRLSDDFYELKKELLDSCEVLKCDSSSQTPGLKILELKSKGNLGPEVKVNRMIYEYNVVTKKIERASLFFNDDYKIKQIVVTYKDTNKHSKYVFGNTRKQVLDNSGQLLSKYKGYQLIDNRNNSKGKK
jgi:hypothetical protein